MSAKAWAFTGNEHSAAHVPMGCAGLALCGQTSLHFLSTILHCPMTQQRNLRLMLILSALMSFASISTDLYLPALPSMQHALHASRAGIELTFSAFLVGFSMGQLFWGPYSDRVGRRKPIAIGIVLFALGSAGCALSDTVWQMMLWRVIQAVGACVGPVLSRAMVRDRYGREQSAHKLSTLILIMGVAPLLGPLLGGQILLVWSWQGIFWLLTIVAALLLFCLRYLPETLARKNRNTQPVQQVFREYLSLLQDKSLLVYALAGAFFYAGAYTFIVATPFAYIEYFHVSPQGYGYLFGINIAGMMLANAANRHLLGRFSSKHLFMAGCLVLALSGLVLMMNVYWSVGGLAGVVLPIFFYMSMNGFIVANSVAGALEHLPHKAGTASSLLGAMHYGSGILSAALVGWFADGTPWAMAWLMGLCGLASLLVAILSVIPLPMQAKWRVL
ncbi:Bcr/CflA family multidrug efflux MFS transporter [Aquitalea palustris]|nr:Bcr/CflA family multidrug efflux MFS transporter [Aquitalea palustris]